MNLHTVNFKYHVIGPIMVGAIEWEQPAVGIEPYDSGTSYVTV